MDSAIALRNDYDGAGLRRFAKATKNAAQGRRRLALAEIYDGGARSDAARVGGVGLQVIRDWVLRFNAHGPDGLVDRKRPGKSPILEKEQRRALADIVESGPMPAIHGVVRWRLIDLTQWVWDECGLSISKQTLSRELRAMGFRKLSARPRHHAKDEEAATTFKKNSPRSWQRSRRARPAESP